MQPSSTSATTRRDRGYVRAFRSYLCIGPAHRGRYQAVCMYGGRYGIYDRLHDVVRELSAPQGVVKATRGVLGDEISDPQRRRWLADSHWAIEVAETFNACWPREREKWPAGPWYSSYVGPRSFGQRRFA